MKTWMRRVFFMGCLLPVMGLAQQKPAEAPPAEKSAKSASAERKPAEDQKPRVQMEPISWPDKYDPRTLQPVRLFMTREEVHETWGEPEKYLSTIIKFEPFKVTKKYVSREEYAAAVGAPGFFQDIYYRKLGSLPFEIRITYGKDGRQDPQHPEMKVFAIHYHMPQPAPAFRLLQELPEVAELCRSGCGLYGDISSDKKPHIVVFPPMRTLRQRIEASQMARLWMPEEYKKQGQLDWTPIIRLFFRKQVSDKEQKAKGIDGFETPIEAISFILERPVPLGTLFKLGSFSSQGRV